MPWLIELLVPLVTAIIGYISKHQSELLDGIFGFVGRQINKKVGEHTSAVVVCTDPFVSVEISKEGNDEAVKKMSDSKGMAEFKQDLKKGDILTIDAYGDGYCPGHTQITIDNENVTYCVVLDLKERKNFKEGA